MEFLLLFRAGKQRDTPRPLIVRILDNTKQLKIIENAANLNKSDQWKTVFINPDLTPGQIEANKVNLAGLKNMAETRNKNLDPKNDWMWGVRGRWGKQHLMKIPRVV